MKGSSRLKAMNECLSHVTKWMAAKRTNEQTRQSNERNASQTNGKWTNGTIKRPQTRQPNNLLKYNDATLVLSFAVRTKWQGSSDRLKSLIVLHAPLQYGIYCKTHTLCKTMYISETGKRLSDRFCEHLQDIERNDKDAPKPGRLILSF